MPVRSLHPSVLFAACLVFVGSALAKPKALLVTGGCCHDYANQKVIIPDSLKQHGLDFDWTISHEGNGRKTKNSVYANPNWINGYALVVHNECYGAVTDVAFINGIASAHAESGVPALVIHCSLHSYRNAATDEWRKFLGVTSMRHERHHPLDVKPLNADHPAMQDFPANWRTPNGELYIIEKLWDNAVPLAHAYGTETQKNHVCIWSNTYGKARIFGTSLGHHNETMQDPVYAQFLAHGARWAMAAQPAPAADDAIPAYARKGYLTYDTSPMGSAQRPLIMRTFVHNPNLDRATVLPNHGIGRKSPKYSPRSGRESSAEYKTLNGIPAAIAVNAGQALSYVWDTTECRLLYAWTDGFLDMANYWGNRKSGRRRGFDYTPYPKGFMFFKALGKHPIAVNGASIADLGAPVYRGYSLDTTGHPTFEFQAGQHTLHLALRPTESAQTFTLTISEESGAALSFSAPNTPAEVITNQPGKLTVLVRPNAGEHFSGSTRVAAKIETPTAEIGEGLFTTLGCAACHSTDGSQNHGPTLHEAWGAKRAFVEGGPGLTVDDAYLVESIKNPGSQTVAGYPKGMMPPYKLSDAQYQSLVLFIKTLK